MIELSIVIPAYNEARRITPTLEHYLQFFSNQSVELIVVLNGCTDQTLEVVQRFQQQYPIQLRFLNIAEAIGKGGAVREGLLSATGCYRGFIDADESTNPEEFYKLVKVITQLSVDGVIASRWMKGAIVKERSWLRQLASRLFILFVRSRFHMPFLDTQCGAKVFTAELVQAVVPELTIRNMAFDVELLYNAKQRGYQIVEVPTFWVDKTSSTLFRSPLGFITNSFKILQTVFSIKR